MQLSQGVEWAAHACVLLSALGKDQVLPLTSLSNFHGVPAPYLAKQMQSLSKAGIVRTTRGAAGGYALAKLPFDITLYDIVCAIEGQPKIFRCTEIRQRGPCARSEAECIRACGIAAEFAYAETLWRDHLRTVRVDDLAKTTAAAATADDFAKASDWVTKNAR